MRQTILILGLLSLSVLFCAGCRGSAFYDDSCNWVIRNNEIPAYSSEYDVFYLYPSQLEHTSGPTLNWFHEGVTERIRHYAEVMLTDLAKYHVRVFSPFIPQLGYDNYCRMLESRKQEADRFDYSKTELEPAIRHTVMALKYYLKHYNDGVRPYVLIGHGQGAVVLYEAMKQVPDISPEKGFAAAYFQGLPGVTASVIRHDFGSRGIAPAAGRYDYGVIVVFNTRLKGESAEPVEDACVINPLNWRTDAEPASGQLNPNSVFCIGANGKKRSIPRFCGAVADPEKGVVFLTDFPAKPRLQLNHQAFRSDIWGVFSGSVSLNAGERIREYLFRHQLRNAK